MTEEWRPVVGHEGFYEVSSEGRVRSLPKPGWRGCVFHNGRYKILATTVGGRAKNYKRVMLMNPKRHAYVHHLVAEAFLGPRPEGMVVLHKDDKTFDNRAEHLRYGDRDENETDRMVKRVAKNLPPAPF